MGKPLSEGWSFMFPVSCGTRAGFLDGLGLYHELQPLALVERIPRHGPRPHMAEGTRHDGLLVGRAPPLERDALPRRAPHVPRPNRRHEPAWPLPWLGEGPRRVRRDLEPRLVEERRRRDHHGEAPEKALDGHEVTQVPHQGVRYVSRAHNLMREW